ncbi:class B sortase [Ammoniphilus sp. CFH 90114]|uniref:class B sortase n=1 Tax=Ammoniphilus sp. CFH 90114 TaxID=2493665 RepID=UPI0013E95393|nr:class B sortase [Ammoniphilus sp. CFH 90114]
MKKNLLAILICFLAFLYSSYEVFQYYYGSYQNQQLNNSIQEDYDNLWVQNEATYEDEVKSPVVIEKFLPLLEMNEETIGWITVPNTDINYPVVKTDNNSFYLDHNFKLESSNAGAIFMDYRNVGDATDRHTIIYGHHMRDGSMFKGLTKYKDKPFFEENRVITLQTLFEETKWEIFSAYVTDTDFYYIATNFRSNHDYVDFLNKLASKSIIPQTIKWNKQDQILTLSTCSYEFNDARFVVHARRIK